MSYKLYEDGEIWKDGKKYAKIYSNGEIWKDEKRYAKMYSNGEIWQYDKKIGKVYDDGEVYIDNQLWGKIYLNNSYSSSKKETVYKENKGFSFNVPPISDDSNFDSSMPGFGIFVIGFMILLVICTIAALFMGGFELWRTFTLDAISYGFTGIIAALLLIIGTIFGCIIQLSKFQGRFWLGLIINTILIIVTVVIGQLIMYGPLALSGLNADILTFVGTFAFMAVLPTAICKILSMLGVKLNTGSNITFKMPIFNYKNTYKPNKSTQYRYTYNKKTKRKQSVLDAFEDLMADIEYKTLNVPKQVWYILIVIIFCISWVFAFKYTGYFFYIFGVNVGHVISLVLFIGLIIIHKKIFDADYKKGLILFAVVLLIIQVFNGLMFGDITYGFMETIDVLGFGQFVGYFIGACLGLSSIAYILDRKC